MELRQELLQRAEELERLVAIYKHKLFSEEMASLNYGEKLIKQSNIDVLGDQRGKLYDIYMRKREEKLREKWKARGTEKDVIMKTLIESLSTSFMVLNKRKEIESKKDHSIKTNSRKLASHSSKSASLRNLESSTEIINEKMSLIKSIKARKSQSLRKNSLSLGEPKNFMHLNAPKQLLKNNSCTTLTAGLSKNKLKISMNSQETSSEKMEEQSEMLKERKEQVDLLRTDQNVQNFVFDVHDTNDFDSSEDFACFGPTKVDSHNMNQCLDVKIARVRKKWGSVERPFVVVDVSNSPFMDVTKRIKRFLKFGK